MYPVYQKGKGCVRQIPQEGQINAPMIWLLVIFNITRTAEGIRYKLSGNVEKDVKKESGGNQTSSIP